MAISPGEATSDGTPAVAPCARDGPCAHSGPLLRRAGTRADAQADAQAWCGRRRGCRCLALVV